MISFSAASVVAPDGQTILHPVTLHLAEQRVSVIGANGSGKSTLARMVNGLVTPSAGTVTVHGNDTVGAGAAVRREVGFVFTDPAAQLIMPTVLEDVELSLRREHPNKAARRAAALETLERFGLAQFAERSVHALSGGQKQLLAIATVLATGPRVLVTDEPTTLLDLRNSHAIGELLCALEQQLIIVTHDLELAARADRTLVIEQGRVVFDGDPDAAIAHYRARALA